MNGHAADLVHDVHPLDDLTKDTVPVDRIVIRRPVVERRVVDQVDEELRTWRCG